MESEYCPDCCVELKKINKKLDRTDRRIWLKCPNCGFIKRPVNSFDQNKELEEFEKNNKLKSSTYRVNLNKYF